MIAHILSTGDEILLGDIIDTNANYLCRSSRELGIPVTQSTAVGDDLDQISNAMKWSSKNADICYVTGGLGPTQDDVTAKAAALAAGTPLELNLKALEQIKAFFKQKGFDWSSENEKQALFPKGSEVIENKNGTAPGFCITINRCLFVFMPGPPKEMQPMFRFQVQPMIQKRFHVSNNIIVERLTVFMLKESALGRSLEAFDSLFPELILGIRVSFPTIEVKIRFEDQPDDIIMARQKIDNAKAWVLEQLGRKVVSETGLGIHEEVAKLLLAKQKTLAIAESCTGGLISNMITNISGSSDFFLFSGITYSNKAKMKVLNVKESTLIEHGAVHEQTAMEMAVGAREKVDADFAISTTGIAGPTGGTDDKPVGMVCIGLASKESTRVKTFVFKFNNRDRNKKMFANSALEMLRKHLSGL